jgi:hypothetical protein
MPERQLDFDSEARLPPLFDMTGFSVGATTTKCCRTVIAGPVAKGTSWPSVSKR